MSTKVDFLKLRTKMKLNFLFRWIINHFNYLQTYSLLCLPFCLSLLPITYLWISERIEDLELINLQIVQLDEKSMLKRLYDLTQNHRFYSQLLIENHQDVNLEIETLQAQIADTLDQLNSLSQTPLKKFLPLNFSTSMNSWQQIDVNELKSKWYALSHQLLQLSKPHNEILHTALINDLFIQFSYLNDKLSLEFPDQAPHFSLVKAIESRLPFIQEHISQLLLLATQADRVTDPFLKGQIIVLTGFIQSDLNYLKHNLEAYLNHPNFQKEYQLLLHNLNDYRLTAEKMVDLFNHFFNFTSSPSLSFSELINQNQLTFKAGSQLWDQSINDLKEIFKNEKNLFFYQILKSMGLTLGLLGLAVYLGYLAVYQATTRLNQLTKATDNFSNGVLSVRVPVLYQDEIGRQGEAFNRMAQKLEEIVSHLYELLNATTTLSNGDLSARIKLLNNESEFDQMGHSFNRMAETFETIINRLQQIGLTLTSSASEIAKASKEQEIIIVEQEATTREIAVAANEISSTAKEFATTMNEVSLVAEQTSNLAIKGKDSLNNMEEIMRQMVEASSHIADKLAVLNEKAANITTVITTITKVADQTNLLSLNASIEAEKAGKYGKSFAVIAKEIRRLADQTAFATLDIEKIVNDMMIAVSSSVKGVDDFTKEIRKGVEQISTVSEQLAKIMGQVQAFVSRFDLVNQGMQAQSKGAEQINESITELSQTAQQTSQSIHQFHKTIQELNFAATQLRILTPFISSNLKLNEEEPHSASSPTKITETFDQTMTSLHLATSKLKNVTLSSKQPK